MGREKKLVILVPLCLKDSSVCGELDLGKTETTRNGQDWERLKEDADVKAQVMVYSNVSPFQQ